MKATVLIAEDDENIRDLIKLYLESEGCETICTGDGAEALQLVEEHCPQLAILDIMMPSMSGLEVTQSLRRKGMMPILILSAKGQDQDKILGLNMGADDYLAKPFNPLELIARVKALLRRAAAQVSELKRGELRLDLSSHELWKNEVPIVLTPTEYKLLSLMMKNPGRIFTKAQLYENINGEFFETDENTIMVHISKLRDKIEDDPKRPVYIKTVRGVGYRFEA